MRLAILSEDVRLAIRRLLGTPAFTLTVAVTLALGIGGTTALFSLIDALLLRPLPVRDPGALVGLCTVSAEGCEPSVGWADFEALARAEHLFQGLAAHRRLPLSLRARGIAERVWGEEVSAGYFGVLEPPLVLGRGLGTSGAPEVVLSEAYWRRRFDARPEALGAWLEIGGVPHAVVGVAAEGFRGTDLELGMGSRTELWLLAVGDPEERQWPRYELTGRLAQGVSRAQAVAALSPIAADIAREHPEENGGSEVAVFPAGTPRISPEARAAVRSFGGLLAAGLGFLLLAACATVAHLQLARNHARSGELAVRTALGAGRGRLAAQLLTESALVSVPGLVLSLPVALAVQHLLMRFSLPFATPLDYDLRLDGRSLLFSTALTAVTVAAFGILPALRGARADLRAALGSRGLGSGGGSHRRLGRTLVAAQVALSLLLLVGAGLFARSLDRAARVDLGFRVDDVLLMNVDFSIEGDRFDEARAGSFYARALDRVRALPGVRAASWAGDVPLGLRRLIVGFVPELRRDPGDDEWETFPCDVVSDGYFGTLGIPVRGREFGPADGPDSREVTLVNEAAAKKYWPGLDPIGRRFLIRGRTGVREVEIVGVAGDVRQRSLQERATPRLYLALAQRYFPEMALHVLASGEPQALVSAIRRELAAIEPGLPVFGARPMREQVAGALSQPRMAAALLGAAAVVTLALACIGVYGLSVRAAAERRRELGIRVALGAVPRDLLRLVLGHALLPVAAGGLAGLGAALLLGRGLESFLFDVRATDGLTYALSAVLLALAAVAASTVPLRRLAGLEPAAVLRQD